MRWKVVAVVLLVAAIAPAIFAQVAHASETAALTVLTQLVSGSGHG